jgi:hypothetical protein
MPDTLTRPARSADSVLRTERFSTSMFAKTIWSERTSRNRITTIQVTPERPSSRQAAHPAETA